METELNSPVSKYCPSVPNLHHPYHHHNNHHAALTPMQSTLTVESIMLLPADLSADLAPHGKSGKRELVSVKFNSIQGYIRVIQLIDKSWILLRQSKINHA